MGLQINPGWQTIYDLVTEVTWLADANLAANVKLGLPPCQTPTKPTLAGNSACQAASSSAVCQS